jgi:SAM-dependent methyltransferase
METEPGKRLRALYASDGGVTAVFSAKVDDYVAARPPYPKELFAFFSGVVGVKKGARVVDVGAGTGLFTEGLLDHGYDVLAVEPDTGMRRAADDRLRRFAGYSSAAGSAEAIPVAAGSVDFIVAAQAFHWFDLERARTEFLRVLKPGGNVALVWNDRVLTDPLHQALDEIFAEYGGPKRKALVAHETQREVPRFFGSCIPAELRWPHEHALSEAGLQSLVFSRSYMPGPDSEQGQEAAKAVALVFRRFSSGGLVPVRYTAVAFVGRPDAAG